MKYEIKKVEPIYTGGNIYCFIGECKEGFFLAESSNFAVRLVNEDPFKYDFSDDVCYPEWQEKYLIRDLLPEEALRFFKEMVNWIQENKPEGNYLMEEIIEIGSEADEILENSKTMPEGWR